MKGKIAVTLPKGLVKRGETSEEAALREVREETGLEVAVGELLGTVERSPAAGVVYVINDYSCEVIGGSLRPGDDASDARWFTPSQVRTLSTSPGLVESLESWGVLAR